MIGLARDHRLGHGAAGDPLHGFAGNVRKGDADDRLAREHPVKECAARPIAQHREQPRNDQRFGERTRDQRAPGLLHEDRRVQERKT